MPTWCHMFNSTLIGAARVWFDELPPESIDGYKDLRAAFLAYFMQQEKYVKDPVEIHNIKQRVGETIEDFMERFKIETRRMKGALECMRISGFMNGVNNPELTKRLNEHVPKTMEEMMITTTAFIRGEAAAASKKKGHVSWKPQDESKRHSVDKRTPKEILATKASKFQPPPPMVTPVEKKSSNKFCDFHNDKGHSTDECMQLKKQIEELVRAGKLSHLIKEIKQGWDQSKVGKKVTTVKDKPTTIYMMQSWQITVKQKVNQSFERVGEITFPQLAANNRTEGPLVIEAEMGGHMIHHMYIDGGSSMEIIYEHCFNRLWPVIKNQMVPATTSLTGFSGETIWPLGQLKLLVTIGDATHSTKAWMNFMVVKSMSSYNGIIERPGLKAIQAILSTVHGMLKFPVERGIVTIRSTILIPTECASVTTSSVIPREERTYPANFTVALNPDFPDQEVVLGGSLSDKGRTELCFVLKKNLDIFDCYPLPEIDWKVESFCGYPFKCSLDAYKGYHQIQLTEANKENTAFHTGHGVYCYTKMPFGLKNIGATYQRLMDKAFEGQVGRNIEVYVDNLVVKSHTEAEMVRDIEETFRTLRKVNMNLNPKKCSFGLAEGVFLGYVITPEGIKLCPDKTSAVRQLPSPRTIKECDPDDQTGSSPEANLLYKPHVTGSGTELLTDGETGLITDLHSKKTPKIFSGTSYHNGSSCVDGSGAGLILTNPKGVEFIYVLRFHFAASNNEAEYEALVDGLRIATQMGVKNVQVNVNYKLVANQVLGTYVAKEDNMIKYLEIVKGLIRGFTTFSISQVPRSKNKKADPLSKIASTSFAHLSKQVLVEVLENKSIRGKEVTAGDCQIHRPMARNPQQSLTPIMAPWSFYKWGIDIAGPFPEWPEKVKFFIVAMDYFTKWIEAKAVVTITGGQVKKFVWDNIVCHFREGNKNLVEELPHVLWAHRTMIKSSHGDTPFSLTYGTEAVIPIEIRMPTYRTTAVSVVNNDEELRLNLDLLEERRECAAVCEAKSKSKMMKYYNARVRGVAFRPGDFVYRSNDASHAVAGGKLGPKWEGPYEVIEALGNGAYKLRSMDGTILPRTWNVANLKRCYL
nr:reverse transcriptase domain-containing protein [Tanacetum cinerariifolium]